MANSDLYNALAGVQRDVQRALGTLIRVQYSKGSVDPVTGRPTASPEVRDLEVRIDGTDGISIATDKIDSSNRLRITVYDADVNIQPEDFFTIHGRQRVVTAVSGLVREFSGSRYVSVAFVE